MKEKGKQNQKQNHKKKKNLLVSAVTGRQYVEIQFRSMPICTSKPVVAFWWGSGSSQWACPLWDQTHSACSHPHTFCGSEPSWEPLDGAGSSSEFWAQLATLQDSSHLITVLHERLNPWQSPQASGVLHICCFPPLLCLTLGAYGVASCHPVSTG